MHAARRAHIQSESDEKVRRALRHNVRTSGEVDFVTGDKVYYKRMDSKEWKGPGVIIGKDGKQVLVKHGGIYVRVHPCRLSLINDTIVGLSEDQNKQNICTTNNPVMYKSGKFEDSSESADLQCIVPSHEQGPEDINGRAENSELLERVEQAVNNNKSQEIIPEHRKEIEGEGTSKQTSDKIHTLDQDPKLKSKEVSEFENIANDSESSENSAHTAEIEVKNKNRGPGRPKNKSFNIEKKSEKLKAGMKVKYKTLESENWLKTELMTRSGKKGGKYDSEWNTRDGDGVWKVVDFERQVTQWEEITSHQTKPLKNTDQIESSSEDDSETETLFTDSYNYYT